MGILWNLCPLTRSADRRRAATVQRRTQQPGADSAQFGGASPVVRTMKSEKSTKSLVQTKMTGFAKGGKGSESSAGAEGESDVGKTAEDDERTKAGAEESGSKASGKTTSAKASGNAQTAKAGPKSKNATGKAAKAKADVAEKAAAAARGKPPLGPSAQTRASKVHAPLSRPVPPGDLMSKNAKKRAALPPIAPRVLREGVQTHAPVSSAAAGGAPKRRKLAPIAGVRPAPEVDPAPAAAIESAESDSGSDGSERRKGKDAKSATDSERSIDSDEDGDDSDWKSRKPCSDTDDDDIPDDEFDRHSLKPPPSRAKKVSRKPGGRSGSVMSRVDLEACVDDYKVRLNKAEATITSLIEDKRFLKESLVDNKEKVALLQKKLEASNMEAASWKAEAEAAESVAPLISNTTTPSTVKRQIKNQKKSRDEAKHMAWLPEIQQQILKLCIDNSGDFAKAVVRQCDPEAYLSHEQHKYAWLPPPRPLSQTEASENGCNTAGAGCLPSGMAVEPPMRCVGRRAMTGGLFGKYDGRREEWIVILAKIMCRKHGALTDGTGRIITSLTDEDLDKHCVSLCSSAAGLGNGKAVKKKTDAQMTYRKGTAVGQYMTSLGYLWSAGPELAPQEAEDSETVLERVYGLQIDLEQDGAGQSRDPKGYELLELVKGANETFTPENLRDWRTSEFEDICKKSLGKEHRTDYVPEGTDIFFNNFPARAAYMRWVALPPRGNRTRCAAFKNGDITSFQRITGDNSILELARLDAWIAAAILMNTREKEAPEKAKNKATDPKKPKSNPKAKAKADDGEEEDADGTGGASRNHYHNAVFEVLLPRAIEGVLAEVRAKVQEKRPMELHMPFSFAEASDLQLGEDGTLDVDALDALPSSKTTVHDTEDGIGHSGDLHAQGWRQITSSHMSPFDSLHYVVATPSFFREHVCAWMGDVRDAFVGKCSGGNEYLPITATDSARAMDKHEEADTPEESDEVEQVEEAEEVEEVEKSQEPQQRNARKKKGEKKKGGVEKSTVERSPTRQSQRQRLAKEKKI